MKLSDIIAAALGFLSGANTQSSFSTTTANDLVDGSCGDVTLIFARGTTETGNVGSSVGPTFYAALESAVGSGSDVLLQGVNDYDANAVEYLEGGSKDGAENM